MRRSPRVASTLAATALVLGCAHDPAGQGGQSPPGAVGTSPLAPFDVNLPNPNSRQQLAAALRQRGFLAPDAPPETQLRASILAFQRSEGLKETGFPDDETLRRLGIDPATKDRSLDPSQVFREGATGAAVGH